MVKKFLVILGLALIVIASGLILWRLTGIFSEKSRVYRIGLLQMAPTVAENMEGFRQGMEELGYKEGKNVIYDYRDANGDLAKLDEYAKELVDLKPDLIFVNTSPATAAIKKATEGKDIPVVFSMVADPLAAGFIESVKSSGNNLTGTSCDYITIAPKRLEILKEIDPIVNKVLIFYRPEDLSGGPATEKILQKAREIGVRITAVPIEKKEYVSDYLAKLKPGEVDAIMDPADSTVTAALAEDGINRAIELKVPLMMLSEAECQAGALACFGVDYLDLGRQSSPFADQILRGIKPADIPVQTPRKFLFVVNLKTADAIGLKISNEILQQADLIIW
jgi:putative ABC transport system substrate-binding protein